MGCFCMPKGQHKYTGEQKVEIIERMHKEHLGIVETAKLYGIYHQRICDWERIYIAEGKEALLVERRGRACAASGVQKGQKPQLSAGQEKSLLEENQQLRMEIEYLKKLNALVLKEEQQNRKRK